MLKGFKDFVFRGNIVDLAIAVIIGGAFGSVVKSLVDDIFTPAIGMVVGKPDFSSIALGAGADGKGGIMVGNFLNAIIAFLLVAAAVYFFVILPMKKITEKAKKVEAPAAPAEPSDEVKLLREIRDSLRKS